MSEAIMSNYNLELEDRPKLKITKYARPIEKEKTKMSKEAAPTETPKAPKAKYTKTRGEHIKDVIIAVLVASIVAFIGGMTFQSKQQHAIEAAVQAVTPTAQAQAPAKK